MILVTLAEHSYANYLYHQIQSYHFGGFDSFGKDYANYPVIGEGPNIFQ